ncbi:hypothetical protein BJY52DRAFT_1267702 [Lactarius psammicola]|nr:hypothetical protein BJY52DRAFT_1267702 [Lactarius psammicola]
MRLTQVIRFSEKLLSNVHRGTAFENRALSLLTEHMSMSLMRVGGSNDGGVDLIGWWWVPGGEKPPIPHPPSVPEKREQWSLENRRRLRILAQCKAEKRKMGPGYLRELEGVVYRHAAAASVIASGDLPRHDAPAPVHNKPALVALLVSESAFTRGCLLAANASPLPFLLVHLPPSGSPDGSALGAIFGNPALVSARGVLRGELEIRWEHGVPFVGNGRPRLWWQGRPLPSWTPDADVNANADATLLTQPSS